jgi:hypothetical protein
MRSDPPGDCWSHPAATFSRGDRACLGALYPTGELRGYVDLVGLSQQMMAGAAGATGTPSAGATTASS